MVLDVGGSNPLTHPSESAGRKPRPGPTAGAPDISLSDFGSEMGADLDPGIHSTQFDRALLVPDCAIVTCLPPLP